MNYSTLLFITALVVNQRFVYDEKPYGVYLLIYLSKYVHQKIQEIDHTGKENSDF